MSKLNPKQKAAKFLIEHPNQWPDPAVLPLIRHGHREGEWEDNAFPELGFVINNPDWPLSIVFQDNVCVFDDMLRSGKGSLREITRTSYPSVTKMLLDGWEIG